MGIWALAQTLVNALERSTLDRWHCWVLTRHAIELLAHASGGETSQQPKRLITFSLICDHESNWRSQIGDKGPMTRECVKEGREQELTQQTFLSGFRHNHRARLFWGDIMSNPLYRAERYRDLAEECRAIAALCAPSTEIRIDYSQMSEHYRELAEAEELSALAYGR